LQMLIAHADLLRELGRRRSDAKLLAHRCIARSLVVTG
jgi:hypothetical protein